MNRPFSLLITLGLLVMMWQACEAPNQKVVEGPDVFDIEQFLDSQYHELAQSDSLVKTAIINDSVETHTVSYTEEEWKKELRFFAKANINRKSWVDYFEIDTTVLDKNHMQISYRTDRDNIPVKEAIIRKDRNLNVDLLNLSIHRSNPISQLDRNLIYAFPDSIVIQNRENLWLVNDQNIKLIYKWDK